MIELLKYEMAASLMPVTAGQRGGRVLLRAANSPLDIFYRIPAIAETVAGYLKEPDYSRFVAALEDTVLRPVEEIYQALAAADFNRGALRSHEKQLYVSLQLRRQDYLEEITKTVIINDCLQRQPPFCAFPLGEIAIGCIIADREYSAIARYLTYYEGKIIPPRVLEKQLLAHAMLCWKQEVMAKGDEFKRIFTGGYGFIIPMPIPGAHRCFLGMQIHKTELRPKNLAVILEVADRLFKTIPPPVSYGLAFAAARLLACLKKDRPPGLDNVQIEEAATRHRQLIDTGEEIRSLLPGRHFYRSPMVMRFPFLSVDEKRARPASETLELTS